jgi:TolA-binding protein
MLVATVLLSAVLVPQVPAAEEPTPFDAEPAPVLEAMPAQETEAAPVATPKPPAPAADVEEHIAAGLKAFIRGRFSSARDEFQKAYDADPRSAAAAFYLGYAHYKLGEPSRRMNPDKERAKELFAKAYDLDPAFQPVWGARKSE